MFVSVLVMVIVDVGVAVSVFFGVGDIDDVG